MRRLVIRTLGALVAAPLALAGLALVGPSAPVGAGHTTSVLVVEAFDSQAARNDVTAKLMGTGMFSAVDTFDAQASTPTAAHLAAHDAVLVSSDAPFHDPALLGDRLADYVDAGGHVVLAFAANVCGFAALEGRLINGGYDPFDGCGTGQSGAPLTLDPVVPGHPLLDGVTTFHGGSGSYHADTTAATGATVVANWSNGRPLVVVKDAPGSSGQRVVGLNFYPVSSDVVADLWWDASTDGARLIANALTFHAPVTYPHSGCSDVPRGVYFTVPFDWAWHTGVTTGVGGTSACEPLRPVSRAEAITILWRSSGSPAVATPHGFIDTTPGAYYQPALRWAAAEGITTGVGGSAGNPSPFFAPDGLADRAQQFTLVWRVVGEPGGAPHQFVDVVAGSFYEKAVNWAAATGVTTGYAGTNRFEPHIVVDRAQMFTISYRTFT